MSIPIETMGALKKLKIFDAPLTRMAPLLSLSQLCSLELGYVSISNSDFCVMLAQNANTLEELRLSWIVETSSSSLLNGYPETPLTRLRSISTQGPQSFEISGLRSLLAGGCRLEGLALDSLSAMSAQIWSDLFVEFVDLGTQSFCNMHSIKFGAPIACTFFWDAVSKLLGVCGENLGCLHINGSPRGSTAPFPMTLADYFLDHTQPQLKELVIIWRGENGLSAEAIDALGTFSPSVSLLHLCIRWPYGRPAELVDQLSAFKQMQKLHIIFLKLIPRDDAMFQVYAEAMERVILDLAQKREKFQHFVQQIAEIHPTLAEVSWSVFNRSTFSTERSKAYVGVSHRRRKFSQRSTDILLFRLSETLICLIVVSILKCVPFKPISLRTIRLVPNNITRKLHRCLNSTTWEQSARNTIGRSRFRTAAL